MRTGIAGLNAGPESLTTKQCAVTSTRFSLKKKAHLTAAVCIPSFFKREASSDFLCKKIGATTRQQTFSENNNKWLFGNVRRVVFREVFWFYAISLISIN